MHIYTSRIGLDSKLEVSKVNKKITLYWHTKKKKTTKFKKKRKCLGKETVWFCPPNVWVHSTRILCIDCTENKLQNHSEQNVHTVRFIFNLPEHHSYLDLLKRCRSHNIIIPASTSGAVFNMMRNNALQFLCRLFCQKNCTSFFH